MKGPLVTVGSRLSEDESTLSGAMLLKWWAGIGALRPSTHAERNGSKPDFRWKVIVRLSDETTVDVIRLKPTVLAAANLELVHNLHVKSTSLASSGWPSDHFKLGRTWNVQTVRSLLTPPLAVVGISVTRPGCNLPCASP